jgi:hypothetical protein
MDKNLPVRQKAELLAECLRDRPLDEIYLVPAVRNYLERDAAPDK